jgi:hypothetical protein
MGQAELSRLHICIEAEVVRARLEDLLAEADDITVMWLGGIVMAALGQPGPLPMNVRGQAAP